MESWEGCAPCCFFFFFNDTATTEIYTLSLHDALPICGCSSGAPDCPRTDSWCGGGSSRSEEHTSELQSQSNLVCRLLLEKKKKKEKHLPPDPHAQSIQQQRGPAAPYHAPICQLCADDR